MITQGPNGNKTFTSMLDSALRERGLVSLLVFVAVVAMGGCQAGESSGPVGVEDGGEHGGVEVGDARLRDARRPAAERDPGVLGRAGAVTLDVEGLRDAVDEARVLQQWRRGVAPPLGALGDVGLRRRLLIEALENRVVRAEVARRGLVVELERLDEMLRLAAVGHRVELPPTPEQVAEAQALSAEQVDARLAARFGVMPERVRRVGLDVLEAALLTEALLDAVDEAGLQQAWVEANTRLVLDVVRVSRVPTPGEIDAAVSARAGEMAAFYDKNRALFEAPERAFVRRVWVPVADDASAVVRAAARVRAEGLRARVAGGADLDAVIAEVAAGPAAGQGAGREAGRRPERRDGRLTVTRAQLPGAFAGEIGALSAVEATVGGWHFYRVDRRAAATKRGLDDGRVQREIAASLLRADDALPAAKRIAGQAAALLRQDPDGPALAALIAESRSRRATTVPFSPFGSGGAVVPGIGVAPELHAAVVALTPADPVTGVVVVRQDYVVARLVSRTAPDPATWPAARAAWVAQWRAAQRPQVVERWLDRQLADQPTWVDGERLRALPMAALGAGPGEVSRAPAGEGSTGSVGEGSTVQAGADQAGEAADASAR